MDKQSIFEAVQQIFRDNFDDEELEITRETCADDDHGPCPLPDRDNVGDDGLDRD